MFEYTFHQKVRIVKDEKGRTLDRLYYEHARVKAELSDILKNIRKLEKQLKEEDSENENICKI